ncbi:hypothetical protein SAMN06275492_1409 [Dethiosulfovibrio salsuginis]|uniref:Uncharacterized protein n=1 Tax=Dethiosulfovibrio salsuginis TaxID=561720 RepID=A0A1X7KZ72_9BACT|nr:hypothetical protein SAMN06275492_1409 [Dethiosulfovibrio salsuginis]
MLFVPRSVRGTFILILTALTMMWADSFVAFLEKKGPEIL